MNIEFYRRVNIITLWALVAIFLSGFFLSGPVANYVSLRFDPKYENAINELDNITVYVTPTGSKYHRERHYAGHNSPISLTKALQEGLSACQICRPETKSLPTHNLESRIAGATVRFIWFCFPLLFGVFICFSLYTPSDKKTVQQSAPSEP